MFFLTGKYYSRVKAGITVLSFLWVSISVKGQFGPPPIPLCFQPGTTALTPILLCGDKPYVQRFIFTCDGSRVKVPAYCEVGGLSTFVQVWSPAFYTFKCYKAGTLGFKIKPDASFADLDWQLYDITGKSAIHNIYQNTDLLVLGNWGPEGGITGTSKSGVPWYVCIPDPGLPPPPYAPLMAAMPELIEGHEYLLMVAGKQQHQGGFTIVFEEGSAVLKDPTIPKIESVKPECSGKEIIIKVNKKLSCASLTATGSEFTLTPANSSIVAATTTTCGLGNTFTEIKLTLSTPLIDGNYKIIIGDGTDGNTLLDICDLAIPKNEQLSFDFEIPKPIFADSVAKPDCFPDSIRLYFPKKISCATIAADGSDFTVTGPSVVNVKSATGSCVAGKTEYVIIKFDAPIKDKGNYQLHLTAGIDGSPLVDECGVESPPQTVNFSIADTVNADFTFSTYWGCQRDTLDFMHQGANQVNLWKWIFNKNAPISIQAPRLIWGAKSNNTVSLFVSNGTCTDSTSIVIDLDNETKADFKMPAVICPEDKLELINTTTGEAHSWKWNYDVIHQATDKDPIPYLMPNINREMYYTIRLVAYNNTLHCSDSTRQVITVLDNCVIGTPTGFTPNNDGLNDFFRPHNALKADNYHFTVFNRLGQKVFDSRNWQEKWDGKIRDVQQATGIYVWMLSYINRDTKKQVFEKGTVALIR